VDQQTNWS